MRAFARPLAAALGGLLAATAVVGVGAAPAAGTGDKNPDCKSLGLASLFKQEGATSGGNDYVAGVVSEDGKYLDVTPAEGVVISAVIVKGGENNDGQGHEVYYPPNSWQDLTAHVKNGEPQGISHWEVCGTKTETPKLVDLKIKKKVLSEVGDSPVTFMITVVCTAGTETVVDETLEITVQPGEHWAAASIEDVPVGATCDISEPAATIPEGWELVDILDEEIVIGQLSRTHDYQKVIVINKKTPEQPPKPTIDLSIVKDDGDVVVKPGDAFTYTLTVTNNGPDKATNVVVEDELPAEVDVVTLPPGCEEEDGAVTCAVGDLEVGQEWVGEIEVVAASDLTGEEGQCEFDNVASVSGHEDDTDSTNNVSTVTTECEIPEQPPATPTINVSVHNPICDNDVPYLEYAIVTTGTDDTTVDITWINPDGDDVVYTDQPLTGRVLWPGAVVDGQGNPLDWPGWSFVNGEWVEGDEFDWVRPQVSVLFHINPDQTVTVAYPPSSPDCDANPDTSVGGGSLPNTGSSTAMLGAVAGGLVIAGGGLLLLRKRRLQPQD